MSWKALVLSNARRATARLHHSHPSPWQTSILRPAFPVEATFMALAGQKREVSDIRRQREAIIAAVESSNPGSGSRLRAMEEETVRWVRPPKGHKYWGLTIFRCTYQDDEAWSQLIKLIRECVQESAEEYGAPDLMESFNLKVFEEPSVLEGASTTLLRERFLEWRSGPAVEQESEGTDGHPLLITDGQGGIYGTKHRYQFCVQVDEESLYSNIDRETKTPIKPAGIRGHVNLINAEWWLPDPEEERVLMEMDDDVEDPLDDGEEPLEGCRLYDVGWMKTHISVFGVGAQTYLKNEGWDINYVRPPGIGQVF